MNLETSLFIAAAAIAVLFYKVWSDRAERQQKRLEVRVDDILAERRRRMAIQLMREQRRD